MSRRRSTPAALMLTGDAALLGPKATADGRPVPCVGAGVALAQQLVASKAASPDATLYLRGADGQIMRTIDRRGTR